MNKSPQSSKSQSNSPPFNFRPVIIGLVIVALGLNLLLLTNFPLKDWLVIGFGIRTFSLIGTIANGIMVVGAIVVVVGLILLLRASLHRRREQRQAAQVAPEPVADTDSPPAIRQRLEHLKTIYPKLASYINSLIAQMDRMDDIQARLHLLITENRASYLQKTEGVLDGVERNLCANLREFINLCIAAGYAISTTIIDDIYAKNESMLDKAAMLTRVSADYINNYRQDKNSSHDEVDHWLALLQEESSSAQFQSTTAPQSQTSQF